MREKRLDNFFDDSPRATNKDPRRQGGNIRGEEKEKKE